MKHYDYLKQEVDRLTATPTDECVEWPFTRTNGYGIVGFDGKTHRVHRVAFNMFHDQPVERLVLHTYDNPACFNPAHLYKGDHKQNTADAIARGRFKGASKRYRFYVKFDTYWQHSPDRFAGPYTSRDDAAAAIEAALQAPDTKACMHNHTAADVKHGIRIYGILSRSEARRDGLRLDWDAQQNCVGTRIPTSTDELFDLEQTQ